MNTEIIEQAVTVTVATTEAKPGSLHPFLVRANTNTSKCISCARDFEFVPLRIGDLLYVDSSGREVRCKKEIAPTICPKCLRTCKCKDGRP